MSGETPDERIRGMGWVAGRLGERMTASVPTGNCDEGELSWSITAEEVERLRGEPEAFRGILKKHNEARGPGWMAQREARTIAYLDPERFEDVRRFQIPDDAFERLRDDPASFDEIYLAHRTDHI